jgi:GT2 family glycosyltransferase
MIDISVIIVNWNTKALLLDCVASLYQTTHTSSLEIIVVDNASKDGSIEALRSNFPDVSAIVNKENLGFAKANNIGIKKAKGRYVCLVNSDVKALDNVLDNMRTYMEHHPEVGALAPKTFFGDMSIQKNCREFPTLRNIFCQEFFLDVLFPNVAALHGREMFHFDYDATSEAEVLSGCFIMVRKEVIAQIGSLDERFFFYAEDVDWCKRIHDGGWKLMYYPGAEAIHFGYGSSSSAPIRFQIELLKANWKYWEKHNGKVESALFWLIKFIGTMGRAVAWFAVYLVSPKKRTVAKISAVAYGKMLMWLFNPRGNT